MANRPQTPAELKLAEQIVNIRGNAELVVRMFSKETDFAFGYNEESVKWLDAYIEIIRNSKWTEEETNQIVSNLGSFLGEAIIRAFGGEWSLSQRGWAVRWEEFNLAYPFLKVAKQMENGSIDSIYSFYSMVRTLHKG